MNLNSDMNIRLNFNQQPLSPEPKKRIDAGKKSARIGNNTLKPEANASEDKVSPHSAKAKKRNSTQTGSKIRLDSGNSKTGKSTISAKASPGKTQGSSSDGIDELLGELEAKENALELEELFKLMEELKEEPKEIIEGRIKKGLENERVKMANAPEKQARVSGHIDGISKHILPLNDLPSKVLHALGDGRISSENLKQLYSIPLEKQPDAFAAMLAAGKNAEAVKAAERNIRKHIPDQTLRGQALQSLSQGKISPQDVDMLLTVRKDKQAAVLAAMLPNIPPSGLPPSQDALAIPAASGEAPSIPGVGHLSSSTHASFSIPAEVKKKLHPKMLEMLEQESPELQKKFVELFNKYPPEKATSPNTLEGIIFEGMNSFKRVDDVLTIRDKTSLEAAKSRITNILQGAAKLDQDIGNDSRNKIDPDLRQFFARCAREALIKIDKKSGTKQ